MAVPDHLGHLAPNTFSLYGYTYPSMAHYIIIQNYARRGRQFRHIFNTPTSELPPIQVINKQAIEEGLEVMLPEMDTIPNQYFCTNKKLGLGTTKLRHKFGEPITGFNAYGLLIEKVLKKRRGLK